VGVAKIEYGEPLDLSLFPAAGETPATGEGPTDEEGLSLSAEPALAPPEAGGASAAAVEDKPQAEKKAPYPPPARVLTQEGPKGIRFDFNQGARLALPKRADGKWRVQLRDFDTGNILFQTENLGASVRSSKRFFVRFGIEVWELDGAGAVSSVLKHEYDARDRDVLIQFPVGTLGDTLGWFPYAARFGEAHGCQLTCAMSERIIPLLRGAYPKIRFVTHEELVEQDLPAKAYATYCLGLFFDDKSNINQPTDFRHVGLHRTAAYILGVDPAEEAPRLALPDESRPIAEPYVCIATQATTQAKYWNNPNGWREVIAFLKANGYRVICIDQKPVHGHGIVWNHIPHGAEDETGDRPLAERARWLRHAEFFIGLGSGLSWLAWAAGAPVVLISGFSHPSTEFATPYRVINWHACNSCWNDPTLRFDHKDSLWCPRHKDTPRQFECTQLITAEQVKNVLSRMPGFGERPAARIEPPSSPAPPPRLAETGRRSGFRSC
jgi:autotransporter strand-loop-strand O-heptosyltransferase